MSGPRRFDWRTAEPKKPPPGHGIKMKKAGTTWWGQRWIEALEQVLKGDAGRLSRGRTYARAGRTHDLVVAEGKVTAKVTGSRSAPYQISITLPQLDAGVWGKAIVGMAQEARFAAQLLAGEMPQAIDEVFQAAGTSLFPKKRADLVTKCSCPDWGDPCKHVAATHYVLGEAFDRDPFLLFELRGKTKDEVLDALRTARGGDTSAPTVGKEARERERTVVDSLDIPTVALGKIKAADYDKPRAALPTLQFDFQASATHGALLRQLGDPVGWASKVAAADALAPLVQAAAEAARKIALAEPTLLDAEPEAPKVVVQRARASTKKSPPKRKTTKR